MLLAGAVLFAVVLTHLDLLIIFERLAKRTFYRSCSLDFGHANNGGRWTFYAMEFSPLTRPHCVVGLGDQDGLPRVARIPLDNRPQFFDLNLMI